MASQVFNFENDEANLDQIFSDRSRKICDIYYWLKKRRRAPCQVDHWARYWWGQDRERMLHRKTSDTETYKRYARQNGVVSVLTLGINKVIREAELWMNIWGKEIYLLQLMKIIIFNLEGYSLFKMDFLYLKVV